MRVIDSGFFRLRDWLCLCAFLPQAGASSDPINLLERFMFRFLAFFFSILALLVFAAATMIKRDKPSRTETTPTNSMTQYNKLTAEEARVIIHKGTEPPDRWGYKGEYTETDAPGLYVCRQCNSPLYTSEHKFLSSCGWPAFDDEIEGAVRREVDADGSRTEILCENCGGHLGHVFKGERLTDKNVRHCVNSVSMKFYAKGTEPPKTIVADEKQAE